MISILRGIINGCPIFVALGFAGSSKNFLCSLSECYKVYHMVLTLYNDHPSFFISLNISFTLSAMHVLLRMLDFSTISWKSAPVSWKGYKYYTVDRKLRTQQVVIVKISSFYIMLHVSAISGIVRKNYHKLRKGRLNIGNERGLQYLNNWLTLIISNEEYVNFGI